MTFLFDSGFWGQQLALFGLLAVPVLIAIAAIAARVHLARLQAVFGTTVLERVLPRSVRRRRAWRDGLVVLAVAGFVLAWAEPLLGRELRVVTQTGSDIVLVVDLSRSMDAGDVDPSRLERVKREIEDLVDVVDADRIGMVTFAGSTFPRLPLTEDHKMLVTVARELSTADFLAQGSELGLALREAAGMLAVADDAVGRAVIVFSDGELHDPGDAIAAANDLTEQQIRIFGVGVGTDPAPIPTGNGGWLKDAQGRTVMSAPSSDVLKDLARITGGAYVQSVAAKDDMETLYREEIRGAVEAGRRRARQKETTTTGMWIPLGLGLLAALVAAWLGDGRRRWGAAAVTLLVAGLMASGSARAGSLVEADDLYRAGRYGEAARQLTDLSLEQPDDPEVFRRLGAARFKAGDYEGAARAWESEARLEGRERVEPLYNSGNANYRAGRLERARELYRTVLDEEPEHPGARKNLDVVERVIEQRRALAEPPPPPPEQGTGDPQDPSDPKDDESEGGKGQPQEGGQPPPEPGEGDEAEQKEGQEGEPKDQDGEGQESEGKASGEPSPSERNAQGDNPPEEDQRGGQKQAGPEDQPNTNPESGDAADLGELDGEPTDEDAEGAQGPPAPGEPFTESQAERYLDGVEEGRPRFRIPGRGGDKPW